MTINYQHPLLRQGDTIEVIGINGDRCQIAGRGTQKNWGPFLAPHSTGLFDAPKKTNWGKGMLGQRFESTSPQRRDVVWTIHIANPVTGDYYTDNDSDLWHLAYSRWKAMFHTDYEATVIYNSVDGERHLGLRLLKEPEPFKADFETSDGHKMCYGSVIMTMAAEMPFYIGPTEKFVWETSANGDFWFTLPYFNPASEMIWPHWYLTDRAQWFLPDYSFGWEEYGRGQQDLGKIVPLPLLVEGENIDVYSRPDMQTIIAQNDNPVMNRMGGRDLEYPIQPGSGDANPDKGCVVRATQVTNPDGARAELFLDRWHSEPFGTPRVVAAA